MNKLTPNQKEIVSELNSMLGVHLSNTYSLMLRLQNFHWNVEGPHFKHAHELFEEHYTTLWKEVDVIAERVRTLGSYPPATMKEFLALSMIEDRAQPLGFQGMLQDLITCSVVVRQYAAEALKTAGLIADEVTADILVHQLALLEKFIWMYHASTEVSVKKSLSEAEINSAERESSNGAESSSDPVAHHGNNGKGIHNSTIPGL